MNERVFVEPTTCMVCGRIIAAQAQAETCGVCGGKGCDACDKGELKTVNKELCIDCWLEATRELEDVKEAKIK